MGTWVVINAGWYNPHLPILKHLMSMKVESVGYGNVVEREPLEVCRIYARLGDEGQKLTRTPPCNGDVKWFILPN